MRRLTLEELFRVGPQGLTEISDETLELRLTAEEQRAMRHNAGYQDAIAEEMLSAPEAAS